MASILVENGTLTPGFIQFIVALTTLLMVIRFGLDALRHRSRGNVTQIVLATLDTVTHTMITYSLGIMQHRSATTSYYQLWAVLLVTLRYSVKIGRPAGIAMKQTPLFDLMSSFWAGHILRSHSVSMLLKVPGWLLWSINSARIIHGFISSADASNVHRENMRLLTDYMRHEHTTTVQVQRPDPSSMKGYRYLVLGEGKKLKKRELAEQGVDGVETTTEAINRILLALLTDENNIDQELVTLERIWSHQGRCSHDGCQCNLPPGCCDILDQKTKDLCLSFALYKLLRRRFFNLPIHEARLQKTRRLVVYGILGEGDSANYKRAFRVSEAEPWWMRCWVGNLARALMRMLLCSPPLFRRWHGKVGQFNLLFSRHSSIHLSQQVKEAVVDSLRNSVRQNLVLNNYLEQAISKNSLRIRLVRPSDNQEQEQAPQNSQADGGHRLFADEAGNANTTILRKGAELGMGLITAARSADSEALWKFLSDFWAGFVVHLAESTKASQHKMYLTAGGELSTHLWALLSHAGYLGATPHGDQTSDTVLQQLQPYNPDKVDGVCDKSNR
uniref:DUF4220 domain-containing protein n=1 Tax=Oryza nivara TaxID=4536 RepID=A0A0E0HVW4_ORYNI